MNELETVEVLLTRAEVDPHAPALLLPRVERHALLRKHARPGNLAALVLQRELAAAAEAWGTVCPEAATRHEAELVEFIGELAAREPAEMSLDAELEALRTVHEARLARQQVMTQALAVPAPKSAQRTTAPARAPAAQRTVASSGNQPALAAREAADRATARALRDAKRHERRALLALQSYNPEAAEQEARKRDADWRRMFPGAAESRNRATAQRAQRQGS